MLQAEEHASVTCPSTLSFGPRQPFGRPVVLLPLSSIGCRLGHTARRAVCVICQIPWHVNLRLKLDVPRRGLAASCTNCSEQFVQDELQWSLEEEWRSSVQTVAEDHGDQVLGPVTASCPCKRATLGMICRGDANIQFVNGKKGKWAI